MVWALMGFFWWHVFWGSFRNQAIVSFVDWGFEGSPVSTVVPKTISNVLVSKQASGMTLAFFFAISNGASEC